ncbi:zf-HC2 domain-containing protein [Geodermatophilus nigrescens]|uniref:Putative zinc-finger n=1 Tax=Geodermatophilus nigrescens TaxID=1070870 RepID=A0A1M5EWU3_9ACTN|nr:zf-HC2 domain-containing protein [Geodermatophilus nigrescens]SHF83596.1 Putative zinc-finger [Geodermatophilus nigrescens]
MSWHVDARTWTGYRAGALSDAAAASVETHLLACAACREVPASGATPEERALHERSWDALGSAVDREPASAVEGLLGRVLPPHVVRLLAAAPALRRAWWAAGTALLALALLAAHLGTGTVGTALFVVTAPLLPLGGVALAYAAVDDLAGDVATTTPYPRFRLLLLRTVAVAAVTLPVTAVLALALPGGSRAATLWLAPALALCALTLALSARADPRRVAAVLTLLWLAVSWNVLRPSRLPLAVDGVLDRSLAFRPAGQAALLCVAVLAALAAVTRRTTFEDRSRR